MYNEDWSQFCDSVGGFLRNYAELIQINKKRFEGKVAIVCVADGFDKLDPKFLKQATEKGLFDSREMQKHGFFVNG